jgi:chromosomal replication initiation ATPase DnaA
VNVVILDSLLGRIADIQAELRAAKRSLSASTAWDRAKEAQMQRSRPLIDKVAQATGVSYDMLTGRRRDAETARARQFGYWLLRQEGLTYAAIAAAFARSDHATVISGEGVVKDRLETDKKYRAWHEKMLALIQNT